MGGSQTETVKKEESDRDCQEGRVRQRLPRRKSQTETRKKGGGSDRDCEEGESDSDYEEGEVRERLRRRGNQTETAEKGS